MAVVTDQEIELSRPRTVSVSATASTLSRSRLGLPRRTSFTITPLTAGITVTIAKGEETAVANQGIVLVQNQQYAESDSDAFSCWQGGIQVVASGNGNVAIQEIFARN